MYIIIFLLSIWQSVLFWNKTPGISVILFVLPFLIFLIKYLEQKNKIKNEKAKLISVPIILLSATYFIFNNSFLNGVNKLAIPILTVLMIIELICDEFTLEKAITNVFGFLFKPIGYFGNVIKNIIAKIKKDEKTEIKKPKNFKRIIKAIVISIPLILIVLILLISADSSFLNLFINSFNFVYKILEKIKISEMTGRIIVIVLSFFYIAGFVENVVLTKDIERNKKEIKAKDNLSIKFILTTLNIMYLIFCIVQVKSIYKLFSMDTNFLSYTRHGMVSYAYYARKGFFELITVSAINLVVLLKSKKKCYSKNKYITIMDISMIVLTGAILISSFSKMILYQHAYGLTILRVLVLWTQLTEGILLVPTTMYVLDKRINLAKTYFIIIVTMYLGLNFANINKLIAKRNVKMYLEKQSVSGSDIYYLTNLGTDAVPEIVKLFDIVEEDYQRYVHDLEQLKEIRYKKVVTLSKYYNTNMDFLNNRLLEINDEVESLSWQEFNVSKFRTKKILKEKLIDAQ